MISTQEEPNIFTVPESQLDRGDLLAKYFAKGHISFQDIVRFHQKEQLDFWNLFDIYDYIPAGSLQDRAWMTATMIEMADDTYTCTILLQNIALSEAQQKHVKKSARDLAKSTHDFLELNDINLFQKEDLPALLQSPEDIEDYVKLYNFLLKNTEYSSEFEIYKKEFGSHIRTLEDFKEVYMHINDSDLREKAKIAIEEMTGVPLPPVFRTE